MTTLTTLRLELRPVEPDDVDDVFAIYSRSEVCEFFDILPFRTLSQAERHLASWVQRAHEGRQFRHAIVLGGRLIGTCGLYGVNLRQERASLGFDLHPAQWGRGIMTEALEVFVPSCFDSYGLRRIQALVMKDNRASTRLLGKLGFAHEGTLREYERWEGKGFVDLEMYSRLRGSSPRDKTDREA